MSLFSLQGYFRVADLTNGVIGKLRDLGYTSESTLTLNTEEVNKNESQSGKRLLVGQMTTGISAALSLSLDTWSSANLALCYEATEADIASTTISGETFPAGLAAGELVRLANPFVTGLSITDSAATPATVNAAHYRIVGHSSNVVEMLNPTGYTQPFRAAYTRQAAKNLVLFSAPSREVYLQFDGINTETSQPLLFEFWRLKFKPIAQQQLLNTEYGSLALGTSILYDATRAPDPLLGGMGRMMLKAA